MTPERKRKFTDKVSLEMTPMIDVVFLLLIFFIITLKHEDIAARVDAMRPQPPPIKIDEPLKDPLTILVGKNSLILEGAHVTEPQLRERLQRYARMSADTTIMIKCADDSLHGALVRTLDICAEAGLRQLAVFSM